MSDEIEMVETISGLWVSRAECGPDDDRLSTPDISPDSPSPDTITLPWFVAWVWGVLPISVAVLLLLFGVHTP